MTLYTWAPEPVRHLFRAARFGAHCNCGPRLRRIERIAWALECARGGGTCGTANMFAVGDFREVAAASKPYDIGPSLIAGYQSGPVVPASVVASSVPPALFDLATSLCVSQWRKITDAGKTCGAAGLVLGMPVCAIAALRRSVHLLEAA